MHPLAPAPYPINRAILIACYTTSPGTYPPPATEPEYHLDHHIYSVMAGSSSLAALACLLAVATLLLVAMPAPATAAPWGQKELHLRVYWQDRASGNATVVTVAKAASTNTSTTRFSAVNVMDDALTVGQNMNTSKIIGRAQGIYVSDSIETSSVMMAMNFVFIEGPYKGSSIAIFGPNFIERKVREMSIIGGTGMFRYARGYVQARSVWLNPSTADATIKYDIFVRIDVP
ncbi:hypothetical protein HU200_029149 [Digitaria exilis]|uniref:Dirigent protein n=1 Tax=Digitaria exilis TaxID=1010633 RepID=A0A835BYU3_9POAL|nr:hypothetical protein HU200_029149 [Digitaria exilis]